MAIHTFTLIILLIVNCVVLNAQKLPCGRRNSATKVDYLKLAIQWGPGVCVGNANCRKHNQEWSIHGLWPQRFGKGDYVEFCCDERLNNAAIQSLINDMQQYWSSSVMEDFGFWNHQWKKHGTCAFGIPHLRGQQQFFAQALKLFKQIQMNKIFSDAKIMPGKIDQKSEYNLDALRQTVQRKTGKRVQFGCRIEDKLSRVPLLSEVYICYDPNSLQMIDCPDDDRCRGRSALFVSKH